MACVEASADAGERKLRNRFYQSVPLPTGLEGTLCLPRQDGLSPASPRTRVGLARSAITGQYERSEPRLVQRPQVAAFQLLHRTREEEPDMDDIKAAAAGHHEEAANQLELAAKLHRDAAKQCQSGNFEKAQRLALSATEADTLANRHAVDAADLYRHHAHEVAGREAEAAAEDAARAAKQEAKNKAAH